MSSSFENDKNNSENMKEDTSFYTFFAGILIVFILYYFIIILKKIFYKFPFDDEEYINCHCGKCIYRINEYKLKIKRKNINLRLIIDILLFLFFLYLFIACCQKAQKKEIFDPYEILEISPKNDISKIKKSYKRLSLKYHPDKNQGNKEAKEKFMLINKAYRILTNDKAKENYYKYGNPDGPGMLTIGLALPLFLFQGQVGFYILLIFSILLIVIFPIIFIKWNKERNKYNNNGLLLKNLPIYYNYLDDKTLITELPFIVGMSCEFNEINIKYNEEDIKDIFKLFVNYFPKNYKNENISFNNMFAISVLYIHFSGSDIVIKDDKFLKEFNINKDKIIEKSVFLIDEIIKIVFELNRIYEFNKGINDFNKEKEYSEDINDFEDYEIKEFNFNLILMLLKFRARLFHETNIKIKYDELLLFPNNKKNIKHFIENNYTSINDLITEGKEKNWLQKLDNYVNIKEILLILPKYKIDINIKNTRYEEAGNLFTFNIKIKRENENNKKQLGFLHSNNYYDNYNEQAFIIIYDFNNKRINNYEKIQFEYSNEEKEIEYNMLTEKNEDNNFIIYLISISYPGLIIQKDIKIDVHEQNHLLKNFIKNRIKDILSIEEFRNNYLLEKDQLDESHEHLN